MACNEIRRDGGGVVGFACTRGRSRARCQEPGCTREHDVLCDFPLTGAATGRTCDRKCCRGPAKSAGKDRNYCLAHARAEEAT